MDHQDILNALNKQYPINFREVTLLRDGPSYTCTVSGEKSSFVIKVYRDCLLERGKQSIEIMTYLSQNGYPVPSIIPTTDGLPIFFFETDEGKRMCVLFNFIDGVEPDAAINTGKIGSQTGEMHNLMENYKGSLIQLDKPYFIDFYISKLHDMGYPVQKIDRFAEYGEMLWRRVEKLPRGFCHGDLHTGNILLTSSYKYEILDFDLASFSFPVFDAMTLCDKTDYFHLKRKAFEIVTRMMDRFFAGYTKTRHISDGEISAVYDFISIRHYQLQAQIIDLFGLNCVDEDFIDSQYDWLMRWREQCEKRRV